MGHQNGPGTKTGTKRRPPTPARALVHVSPEQHLKQLKEAGLIRGDVDGPRVCYCVEPGAVALIEALVEGL